MKKIGSIKELREKLGISQSELSRKTKVPQSSISNWEAGNWDFSLKSFMKIKAYANINGYDLEFIK